MVSATLVVMVAFAGIAPTGVFAFVMAQLVGMVAAVSLARWFWRS